MEFKCLLKINNRLISLDNSAILNKDIWMKKLNLINTLINFKPTQKKTLINNLLSQPIAKNRK